MGDVRKLMARLNPTTVRYDIGSGGGAPELTAQDVAAALAFVPPGIGREVFCLLWWPDGAKLTPNKLDEECAKVMHDEISRRIHAVQDAKLALAFLESRLASKRAQTFEDRREVQLARNEVERARAEVWPINPHVHAMIRTAVVDELRNPNLCPKCKGRGEYIEGTLLYECDLCDGYGIVPVSNSARAHRIGRDESTYRKVWKGPYEWLYVTVASAENSARMAVARALS